MASAFVFASPPSAESSPKPVIYLTFDDGPGSHTNAYLDLLDAYHIRASFFVNGQNVAWNPTTARRVIGDGHAIANHTWSHPSLVRLNDGAVVAQLSDTTNVVRSTTGSRVTCYRPPYGATNERVHRLAASVELTNARWFAAGKRAGLWDIDTGDWRLNVPSSGWSPAAMMRQLNRAGDGDTILLHDGPGDRSRGYQVLAGWLAANRDRFDFQPLPGCGGIATELSIDPEAPEAWPRFQVGRLYKAYFDRPADPEGLEYWTRLNASGVSLEEISVQFAASSEFQSAGALSDRQFIGFVYAGVLSRPPDLAGSDYWTRQLASGAANRGSLMVYFSESGEHIRRTARELTKGCFTGDIATSYLCLSANVVPYH